MRLFIRLAAFHTRQLLRTSFFVQQAVTAPLAFLLLGTLGGLASGHIVAPNAWFTASVAGLWATTTTAVGMIGFQRFQGTLEHLVMSTAPPSIVFGGLCAGAALIGLVGVPVAVLGQLLLGGGVVVRDVQVLAVLLTVAACVASSAVLASLFVVVRGGTVVESLLVTPMWLLCGLVIPVSHLPAWALPLAALHPLTGAVALGRSASIAESWGWAIQALALSAVWTLVARRLLSVAVHRARVAGTLALS
ncbi:ABC-2 type transport system permease protein [Frondihabitans sp. PhB188]|uniref:ABC transporter permease n=1 Tax=Frondihabitans sp. PhB188 TaxID=2485200 RepID=UPI000F4A6BB7|nr:ABC transporter permease [Frondihabitans sp. PhB188]ROQ38604.1 ABC-2 type transport system permease protein [Frondihabitans sp. PhB188]